MTRLAAFLLLLLTATAAAAQTGSLAGFVVAGERRAGGVSVTAHSSVLQNAPATITSATGAWWIAALPAGTYDVTFALRGHQTVTRRAEVREGEQTRIDALLEPSQEEESVTRTAGVRGVGERPQLAWSIDPDIAEALPLGRLVVDEVAIAPRGSDVASGWLDGSVSSLVLSVHRDATRSNAVIFGAPSAELNDGTIAIIVPHGGGDELLTLRSSVERQDDRTSLLHEVSFGTPLTETLWTFVSGSGSAERKLGFARTSVSPTARDTADATLVASDAAGDEVFTAAWTHLQERFTVRATAGSNGFGAAAYGLLGSRHEMAAGVERIDRHDDEATAFFVRDRWTVSPRVSLELGARLDDDALRPRVAAVVDLMAERRLRLLAAYGDVADPHTGIETDELMLALAKSLGSTGYARAALVRSDGETTRDALLFDAQGRYLLFAFGASVTLQEEGGAASAVCGPPVAAGLNSAGPWSEVRPRACANSRAAGWFQVEPPVAGYDFSAAVLQRWQPGAFDTDFAIRFGIERETYTPFVAVDIVNTFETEAPRLYRVGVGLRR